MHHTILKQHMSHPMEVLGDDRSGDKAIVTVATPGAVQTHQTNSPSQVISTGIIVGGWLKTPRTGTSGPASLFTICMIGSHTSYPYL